MFDYYDSDGIFVNAEGEITFFPSRLNGLWYTPRSESVLQSTTHSERSGLKDWEYHMPLHCQSLNKVYDFIYWSVLMGDSVPSDTGSLLDYTTIEFSHLPSWAAEFLHRCLLDLCDPCTLHWNVEIELEHGGVLDFAPLPNGYMRLTIPLSRVPCELFIFSDISPMDMLRMVVANIPWIYSEAYIPLNINLRIQIVLADPTIQLCSTFMTHPNLQSTLPDVLYVFIRLHKSDNDFWATGHMSFREDDEEGEIAEEIEKEWGLRLDINLEFWGEEFTSRYFEFFHAVHKACGFDPYSSEVADYLGVPSIQRFVRFNSFGNASTTSSLVQDGHTNCDANDSASSLYAGSDGDTDEERFEDALSSFENDP